MAITAVLLAGGQSRRMGCDKATLNWGSRPLWQWQLEKLRALAPAQILVSARPDAHWLPPDIQMVVDAPPSRGPLSGLCAAFACFETEHLLALAVDMPFITVQQLRTTCDLAVSGCGVIPLVRRRPEPIAAIYPREASDKFESALLGPDFALHSIVQKLIEEGRLHRMQIPEIDWHLYKSINQPRDLDFEE